jgi:hypothetical protein
VTLATSSVSSNAAAIEGGGIFSSGPGSVTLDGTSSVDSNSPDDCVGTSAC